MAQVKIHDVAYELPESFNLGEMRILERYSEGHMEGFEISKMCGAIHVAIARARPELSFDEIEATINALDSTELEHAFDAVAAAGQSPPAPNSDESSESSNGASDTSSDATPESETPESSGSPDLAAFRSFHSTSSS